MLSTDFGANWTTIAPTSAITPVGRDISAVTIRGNLFLAASVGGSATGLILSNNAGTTWTNPAGLPAGAVFDVVPDPTSATRYYAAVQNIGIFRSENSGANWTDVTGPAACAPPAAANCNALRVAITGGGNTGIRLAVATTGRVYAIANINGQPEFIGFTTDRGANWTAMDVPRLPASMNAAISGATNNGLPIVITTVTPHNIPNDNALPNRRIRITGVVGNTAANGDFSIMIVGPNQLQLTRCVSGPGCTNIGNGAYVSGGMWSLWTSSNPEGVEDEEDDEEAGGQVRNISIAVDPTTPTLVYIGGDRQDDGIPFNMGINQVGANTNTGNLWRGDTTVPPTNAIPSPQWSHLTDDQMAPGIPAGGTANGSAPHADSRSISFFANGDMIETDDGGIYRRSAPQLNTGDWFSLIGNLQVNEMHDIAFDPVSNVLIGGSQDTGNPQQGATAALSWLDFFLGDGGDVAVDALAGGGLSMRYTSASSYQAPARCQFNAANQPVNVAVPTPFFPLNCNSLALTPVGADPAPTNFPFVTLVEVNSQVGNRLVIGAGNGIYESTNAGANVQVLRDAAAAIVPGAPATMVAGHTLDQALLYASSAGVLRVRTTATGTLDPTATQPAGGAVVDVDLDPVSVTAAYTISTNSVASTTNTGATWTDITGDLMALDPGTLRSIKIVAGMPTRVFVGADRGVFQTTSASPGAWNEVDVTRLPNAPVFDLDYDPITDTLYAATLGRGAYSLTQVSNTAIPVTFSTLSGNAQPFNLALLGALSLNGSFSAPYALNLTNVKVTLRQLLLDGTTELVGTTLPLTLNATPPLAANAATLSALPTPANMTMLNALGVTTLSMNLGLTRIGRPSTCNVLLGGVANLRTSMLVDDGIHPPLEVHVTDTWICSAIGMLDL